MFIWIKVDCIFLLLLFYLIDLPCLNKNKVQVQVQEVVQRSFQPFSSDFEGDLRFLHPRGIMKKTKTLVEILYN